MMGHKQKLKSAAEDDILSGWRRFYCYTQRAGVCKAIKKKLNKRARKDAKREIQITPAE